MKTILNVAIELETGGDTDVTAFEQDLRHWLEARPQVQGVSIGQEGAGNVAAWRRSREAAFGPALHNPFAPASRPAGEA